MNIFTEEEQRKKQLLAEQAKAKQQAEQQAKLQAEQAKAAQQEKKMKIESEKVTPKVADSSKDLNLQNPPPASTTTPADGATPLMPNRKARKKAEWKEKRKLKKQNRNNSNDAGQNVQNPNHGPGPNNSGPMNGGGPRGPGPGGPIGQGGPMGQNGHLGPRGPMGQAGPMGPGGPMGQGGPMGHAGPMGHGGPRGPMDEPRGPGGPMHHPMGPRFGAPGNGGPYRHRAGGEFEFQPRSSYGPPGFRPRGPFPPNQQFRPPGGPPPQHPQFHSQPPNQQFRHDHPNQHYPNQGWVETGPPRQHRPLVEPPGNSMPQKTVNQDEINRRVEANKKRGNTKVKVKSPRDPAQITPKSKTVSTTSSCKVGWVYPIVVVSILPQSGHLRPFYIFHGEGVPRLRPGCLKGVINFGWILNLFFRILIGHLK